MRHTVFFDLDGTLLPLDMEPFFGAYMDEMRRSGALDINPQRAREKRYSAKRSTLCWANDGTVRNKDVFFATIKEMSGRG